MPFGDSSAWLLVLFGGLVLLAAALVQRVPGETRVRLRRGVLLFGLYAFVVGLRAATGAHAGDTIATGLQHAAALLALLLAVHLAALFVFDVLLRALRLRSPDIVHDLVVGSGYVVAVFWSLHHAGVNLTGLVATSAVVTAVIGLSLQSTLGNVIGGLALQLDDSIREGEWIELESKTQGLIKKVRWRHTVIETRDWDTLLVPNTQLIAQTIKILGRREGEPVQHRMWVYFNVDYRFAPHEVIRAVDEALQTAPMLGVAVTPKPHAVCMDFAHDNRDSFAYYAVRYWLTDLARDDPTSSLVRERLYAALQRAQIPLALPGSAVFLTRDDSDKLERKRLRTLEAHRAALKGVALFSNLASDELTRLAESVKSTPFAPGEVIMREGTQAHWLYVLTSGEVEVSIGTDEAERHVASLEAPAFFGEMALTTGAAREATVVAKDAVECLRVDREDFRALVAARPELAHEMSAILAERHVGLVTAREGLDQQTRERRIASESKRILGAIREFFALE